MARPTVHGLRRLLASSRLAIWLLAFLAVSAMIGGIVPQASTTPNAELVYRGYGPILYFAIRLFNLGDVFRSWWFLALLTLFYINLIACTSRRLVSSIRRVRHPPTSPRRQSSAISPLEIPIAADADAFRRATSAVLKRRHFQVWQLGNQIVGIRWRFSLFFPDLVHFGVLTIVLGTALSLFRSQGELYVDDSLVGVAHPPCSAQQQEGCLKGVSFAIRVEEFGAEPYSGTPIVSGYWADVTIIGDKTEVMTERIEVNRPLTYHGVSLYLSRYGYNLSAARITLRMIDWERRMSWGPFALRIGEALNVPGAGDWVVFARFFTTYATDSEGRPINVDTPSPLNPAVVFYIWRGEVMQTATILLNSPLMQSQQDLPYSFIIEKYEVPRYITLRYSRDPGWPVVWFGFALVVAGLIGLLCFKPACIWVTTDQTTRRATIGADQRSSETTQDHEVERIARAIEAELNQG